MNRNIQGNDLRILQNEKSEICISIIMPTHRLSPDRRTDPAQLEKNIQQVRSYLQGKYDDAIVTPLTKAIDELYEQIDFLHNAAGIGLFVSSHVKKLIHFFFPVKESVTIAHSFNTRDLLYESYYDTPYVVLLLTQKEARLFNARLNTITEITDDRFPQINKAEYEYNRPTRGSSYVGNAFVKEFEKDKSISEGLRLQSFFRQTDGLLNPYVNNGAPLIVTGEKKDLAYFKQVTSHRQHIAHTIQGNYAFREHELGALAWEAMKLFLDIKKEKQARGFKEKNGTWHGITGIENIWKAVQEGRGYKLLVEKDHTLPGYLSNNDDYVLHLHALKQPHRLVPDVVNRLIEQVLEKKGEVIMMENGALEEFQRIALITRY